MRTLQLRTLLAKSLDHNGHESVAVNSLGKLAYIHIDVYNLLELSVGLARHKQLKGGIIFGNIPYIVQLRGEQRFVGLQDYALVLGNVIRIGHTVEAAPHHLQTQLCRQLWGRVDCKSSSYFFISIPWPSGCGQ